MDATSNLTGLMIDIRSTHLALVYADPPKSDTNANLSRLIGIVTMEDVIEEIMQEEIVDETDIFTDNKRKKKRSMRCPNMDLWPILNFQTGSRITPQLKIAVLRHLVANTIPFGPKYAHTLILQGFLNCSFAKEVVSDDTKEKIQALYEAGKESNKAVFTLQGSLTVEFTETHLQFEAGAFTLFGESILSNINETFPVLPDDWNLEALLQTLGNKARFTPDFNTRVTSDVLFLEITAEKYLLIRYLSQKIQTEQLSADRHGAVVQLFEKFWERRHSKNLQILHDSSGVSLTEESRDVEKLSGHHLQPDSLHRLSS
ncbi:hypothetical protein AAHC03_01365 [Spirometra sp. Aus1]